MNLHFSVRASGPLASSLHRDLTLQFPRDHAYVHHLGDIADSVDRQVLLGEVEVAHAAVVVVDPTWLDRTDEHGLRLLDRVDDRIRLELVALLGRSSASAGLFPAILPVLLDDVPSLADAALPAELADLAGYPGFRLRTGEDYDSDLEQIVEHLTRIGFRRYRVLDLTFERSLSHAEALSQVRKLLLLAAAAGGAALGIRDGLHVTVRVPESAANRLVAAAERWDGPPALEACPGLVSVRPLTTSDAARVLFETSGDPWSSPSFPAGDPGQRVAIPLDEVEAPAAETAGPAAGYADFLAEQLAERGMTRAAFADRAELSKSWVTMMLKGDRSLKLEYLPRIEEALDLGELERLELRALVERVHANTEAARLSAESYLQGLRRRREAEQIGVDALSALSSWYVGAILELIKCDGYCRDPRWIASTLYPRISVSMVQEALATLQRLEVLGPDLEPIGDLTNVFLRQQDMQAAFGHAILEIHKEAMAIGIDSLAVFEPNERYFTSGFTALGEVEFERMRQSMKSFAVNTALGAQAGDETPNRLFRFFVGLFPASQYTDITYHPADLDQESDDDAGEE